MNPKFMRSGLTAVVVLGMHWPSQAQAQPARQPNGYTWGELALLPEYCPDTQGVIYGDATNPSPRAAHWVALMGESFWVMHHYCRALNLVHRAQSPGLSKNAKGGFLESARGDYEYVVRNAAPSMSLMPEVLLRYGELHLMLGELDAAQQDFARARTLKPDYWPAYTRWIDVQIQLKLVDQARALAKLGLQHSPGNPELQRRFVQTGGKPGSAEGKPPGGRDVVPAEIPAPAPTSAASR